MRRTGRAGSRGRAALSLTLTTARMTKAWIDRPAIGRSVARAGSRSQRKMMKKSSAGMLAGESAAPCELAQATGWT